MQLTSDEVRKVAHLARLRLSEAELQTYTRQLGDVLKYVELLNAVDTSDVAPLAHPHETENVLRPDEPRESLPQSFALRNAPRSDGKYFLVPAILENP